MKCASRLKIRQLFSVLVVGVAILFSFQSCSTNNFNAQSGQSQHGLKILGAFSEVHQLAYGPKVEAERDLIWDDHPNLDVDLFKGEMKHSLSGVEESCALDDESLGELRRLLATPKICTPDFEPDQPVCMLYVYADIRLTGLNSEGGTQDQLLRPQSCAGGTFLCQIDQDSRLRQILSQLAELGCR